MNPTAFSLRTPAWRGWPFLFVAAVWLVVATQQITLPGVYMDAVNPDYLVVGLLNRNAQPIAAQLLNGNYLFGHVPVLITYYHESQRVWLGLPFFALFGTTVEGLRLTHAMFALAILAALYALLVRGALRPWQAALACAALAVDPAFSYAFRTQSYITLAPTAWLFLSLYALQREPVSNGSPRRWLVASGAFYGLAISGYFIYTFYFGDATRHLAVEPRHLGPAPRQLVEWVVAMVAVRTGCWRDLLPHRLWLEHPERGRLRRGLGAVPANAASHRAHSAHRFRWPPASRIWERCWRPL